jgi:hypothetical protein
MSAFLHFIAVPSSHSIVIFLQEIRIQGKNMRKSNPLKLGATFLLLWGGFDIITSADDNQKWFIGLLKLVIGGLGFVITPILSRLRSRTKDNTSVGLNRTPYRLREPVLELIESGQLPGEQHMLGEIDLILGPMGWGSGAADRPPTKVAFTSACLKTVLEKWGVNRIDALDHDQIGQLFVLYRTIGGHEDEATRYLPLFADQAPAHHLREEAQKVGRVSERFNAERKRFIEAYAVWEAEGGISRYHDDEDLRGFLQDMPQKDVDLWHDIVRGSEAGSRPDFEAIYWIAAQPECDRATIAMFIINLAGLGYLAYLVKSALNRESTEFADQIDTMIKRWNTQFYTEQRFAVPDVELKCAEQNFMVAREEVATLLNRAPWPIPEGLFQPLQGRETKASYSFAHNQGLYVLPPRSEDYITYYQEKSAL